MVIKPTPGRVVWFTPPPAWRWGWHDKSQPLAAIVAYVWRDRMVNLAVFDQNGRTVSETSVTLVQDGDEKPADGRFCEWMPYQKGQAAKAEALGSVPT